MGRRVGLLGGTFDPIHVGHLVAAVNARAALGLDEVLLVVANLPWQKVGDRSLTLAEDRLAVVQAVVEHVDGLQACAVEIERGGLTYSIDTVEALIAKEPDLEPYLIVGADVVPGLPTWQRVEELKTCARLVVVNRPGSTHDPDDPALSGWEVASVTIPALEISSTDLRERVAQGRPLDYLVPEAGIRVIRDHGLYALDR